METNCPSCSGRLQTTDTGNKLNLWECTSCGREYTVYHGEIRRLDSLPDDHKLNKAVNGKSY